MAVRRRSGAASPLTQPRTMLATAAGFSSASWRARFELARSRSAPPAPALRRRRPAARCSSSTTSSSCAADPALGGGGGGASSGVERRPDQPKHDRPAPPGPGRRARRRRAAGPAAQGCFHSGSSSAGGGASTRKGALITLHRVAAVLVEADALLHQRGELARSLRRLSGAVLVLPLASVTLRWFTTTAAFRRLHAAGGVARDLARSCPPRSWSSASRRALLPPAPPPWARLQRLRLAR